MPPSGAAAAELDLRGTPCPLNFIRTKLTLETLKPQACLRVDLDAGEPEQMVCEGLRTAGHHVTVDAHPEDGTAVRLWVRRHG